MKIRYDAEVDALSITFREATITTKHLGEGIAADYDAEGKLAGIEILDVVKRFGGRVKRGSESFSYFREVGIQPWETT